MVEPEMSRGGRHRNVRVCRAACGRAYESLLGTPRSYALGVVAALVIALLVPIAGVAVIVRARGRVRNGQLIRTGQSPREIWGVVRPASQRPGLRGHGCWMAEISMSRVTFSLTRTPPVSRAAFQTMP
jgi:hypothetical protein